MTVMMMSLPLLEQYYHPTWQNNPDRMLSRPSFLSPLPLIAIAVVEQRRASVRDNQALFTLTAINADGRGSVIIRGHRIISAIRSNARVWLPIYMLRSIRSGIF